MNNDTTEVIACRGLVRTFVQKSIQVNVLRGVDLNVQSGEQVAIVGTSGSGKSTLLHLLAGLDTPTSGRVTLDGQELFALSVAARGKLRNEKLGFVYQSHRLLPEFTALENVAIPLLIRRIMPKKAFARARETLDRVGLNKRQDHKPGELSGGEQQRTAIARAIVTEPRCILADEPTGNLDRRTADTVYQLLLGLNRTLGTSLVLVTHDLALAECADRVVRIEDGVSIPLS